MHVVQVVEHHPQSGAWIAVPQPPKGLAQFDHALARAKDPAQAVRMDIVEAEELLGSVAAMIGGAPPAWAAVARPGGAAQGAQFERAPLVEAYYRRPRGALAIEPANRGFFWSKSGSEEVFQVRTRCAVRPSRRSNLLTHSSLTAANSLRLRQYSASLGTDHTENGSPRSAGLDSATSTSSRSCVARTIGGRPLGLATRSKLTNPLRLNRWSQS